MDRSGAKIGAVEKLAAMYRALAERRRLDVEFPGEWYDDKQDRAFLLASLLIFSFMHMMTSQPSRVLTVTWRVRTLSETTSPEARRAQASADYARAKAAVLGALGQVW